MKEKFEKLRDMASDVSDTTVEDANTYTILSLCDQLVNAIDVYLEDQEDCNNENCVTCKDCLYYESCVSPFKYDNDTSVYFCDKFVNKNCSNIESKEKTK